MSRVATIEAALLLDAKQWEQGFSQAGQRLRAFEKATGSFSVGLAASMASSALSVGTLTAAVTVSVTAATHFETALRDLNVVAGYSEEVLGEYADRLRTVSLELGTTTGATANVKAATEIASSGFSDLASNGKVVETTLKAISASGAEASVSARLVAGSLKAYGASADQAARFGDVFFKTADLGITTFPELAATLGNVTSIAATAGISIEELGAAVATATAKGVSTSSAVDGIRGAISNLLAPSVQAQEEMARLGIEINETTLKNKGLATTLQEIARANGGSAASFKLLLGDVQAVSLALALMKDGGTEFVSNIQAMEQATGSLDSALAEKGKAFSTSMGQMKVALEAAGIAVGEVFLPPLKLLVQATTEVLKAFVDLPDSVRSTGLIVAGLGATFVGAATAVSSLGLLFPGLASALSLNRLAMIANTNVVTVYDAACIRLGMAKAALAKNVGVASAALGKFLLVAGSVALAVGAIYVALEGAKALQYEQAELAKYTDQAAKATANLDEALRSTNKSVSELLGGGKTAKALTDEILALHQAQETLTEQFQKGQLSAASYEKQIATLRAGVVDLKNKRQELAEVEQRRAPKQQALNSPGNKQAAKAEEAAQRAAEERRKEALAEQLSAIKQLADAKEISARQEIAALEEVLAKNRDISAEEQRRIKEQIAGLRGSVKDYDRQQADKAAAEATQRAEAARKAAMDAELDRIKTLRAEGKISADEEINQLKRVATEYASAEELKRSIHQKTLQLKTDASKKAADEAEKAEKKRAQEAEDLSKARDEGAGLKVGANNRKVDRLQEETERKGVDNRKKINESLKENLALQLEQIQREADRESAGVESADLLAQIRANAEAKMREEIAKTAAAQKAAVDEQIEALKKLEAEKNKKPAFGSVYGIEELGSRLQQEQQTSSRSKRPAKDSPMFGGQSLADIERQLTQDIGLKVETITVKAPAMEAAVTSLVASLKSPAPSPLRAPERVPSPLIAGAAVGGAQRVSGSIDVRVSVDGSGEIESVSGSASLDGRFSELTRAARSMSGRISFGGG